jgi:predicted extracellular nuclease
MMSRLGKSKKFFVMLLLSTLLFSLTQVWLILPKAKAQVSNHVVISEIYGGGGNSGATFKNDFIELYNPTSQAVSLTGWSVQYASAAGTTWYVTNLNGNIPALGYYLIQLAAGSGGTTSLPAPDATGTTSLSATSGKVALASKTTVISGKTDANLVDFVGYGNKANVYEGKGPTKSASNTASVERKNNEGNDPTGTGDGKGNGWDTDNNSTDFVVSTPVPQNTSSPTETGSVTPPPSSPCVKGTNGISHMIFEIQGAVDVSPVNTQNVVICGTDIGCRILALTTIPRHPKEFTFTVALPAFRAFS